MVATYLIASSFMSVYHMAVDTIFICASEYGILNNRCFATVLILIT